MRLERLQLVSQLISIMARTLLPLPPSLLAISCALVMISSLGALGRGTVKFVEGQRTWCVAKPSADEATLLANLNYACSQVDCSMLQKGCSCFYPDNVMSHASVAMNLYYQSRGRNYWNCYFKNSALIVTTDPSFGSCVYPYT